MRARRYAATFALIVVISVNIRLRVDGRYLLTDTRSKRRPCHEKYYKRYLTDYERGNHNLSKNGKST
jgi:hypothetical protein